MIYIKFFENYKNIDFDDLWIEFGYYNQYLICLLYTSDAADE